MNSNDMIKQLGENPFEAVVGLVLVVIFFFLWGSIGLGLDKINFFYEHDGLCGIVSFFTSWLITMSLLTLFVALT